MNKTDELVDILQFGFSDASAELKPDEVDELNCWLSYSEGDVDWNFPHPIDDIDETLHRCLTSLCTVLGVVGGVLRVLDWFNGSKVVVVVVANVVGITPLIEDAMVCRRWTFDILQVERL